MLMKIYSWNVNSLRSYEDKYLKFLKDYNPDIVGIQELRATEDQLSFFLKFVDGFQHCSMIQVDLVMLVLLCITKMI